MFKNNDYLFNFITKKEIKKGMKFLEINDADYFPIETYILGITRVPDQYLSKKQIINKNLFWDSYEDLEDKWKKKLLTNDEDKMHSEIYRVINHEPNFTTLIEFEEYEFENPLKPTENELYDFILSEIEKEKEEEDSEIEEYDPDYYDFSPPAEGLDSDELDWDSM